MYLSLILLQTIFNYEKKIITKSYYMYSLVLFLQNKQIEHSIDSIFCALNYILKNAMKRYCVFLVGVLILLLAIFRNLSNRRYFFRGKEIVMAL